MSGRRKTPSPLIGTVDGVCGGRPVILGTRIEPRHIACYRGPHAVEQVLKTYPGLTREQIRAAFDFVED